MGRLADELPHRDMAGLLEAGPSRLQRLKARRKLWLEVHLWLGLVAGAALVLIGLTGSILVFWEEIDEWLNADLMRVEAPAAGPAAYRPMADIEASIKAALPADAKPGYGIYFPRHAEGVFTYWFQMPGQPGGEDESHNLFVNPYTAQVTGQRVFYSSVSPLRHCFIGFVFKLHYALLLHDPGAIFVGILALLGLISLLTGLIVWWPLTGNWAQALTVKRRASAERLNFDLHKVFGVYLLPVLGVVLLSGVYFNLPGQFHWAVRQFSPATPDAAAPPPQSSPLPGATPIGPDRAMAIAEAAYPGGRWHLLSLPDGERGVYKLVRIDVPDLSRFWSQREVMLDPYSGRILEVRAPDTRRSAGETFLDWQWPLHSGKAFGWTGRILVFLSGLACPVLFVTGLIRWLQKRKARRLREGHPSVRNLNSGGF